MLTAFLMYENGLQMFSPMLQMVSSFCWLVSLLFRNFLVWYNLACLFFSFVAVFFWVLSKENHFSEVSPYFLPVVLQFCSFTVLKLSSILGRYCAQGKLRVSFCSMHIRSCPGPVGWWHKPCLLSSWHAWWKQLTINACVVPVFQTPR